MPDPIFVEIWTWLAKQQDDPAMRTFARKQRDEAVRQVVKDLAQEQKVLDLLKSRMAQTWQGPQIQQNVIYRGC